MRLISKQAFREYMAFRRMSNKQLAAAAKTSPTTIAFLRSTEKSARNSCGPATARRIEEALNAPPGSLFAAEVLVASSYDKPAA